jgi:hypothetical protein
MPAIGLEPLLDTTERFGLGSIQSALGIQAHGDETGFAQDSKVSGHTGLTLANDVNKVADAELFVANGVQ